MEVFIDGESKGKFNAKSDTPRGQKVLYSVDDLDYGNHTIKVVHEWEDALDDFYDEHEYVNTDAKARSRELFILDDSKENSEHSWKVRQIIDDSDGDHDWAITGTVDLDTTQSSGEVVFFDYSVSN